MKHSPATRKDHEAFCVTEGWTERKRASGKGGTHHVNFELALPDGRTLLTRVSHPVDRTDYGEALWAHVLRDQLEVDEGAFWVCVREGAVPDRGGPTEPPASLPAKLAWQLIHDAGVPEEEVRGMSKAEAIRRITAYWSQ